MNRVQEDMFKKLLESTQETEFWIKRIALKLGADKDLEPKKDVNVAD